MWKEAQQRVRQHWFITEYVAAFIQGLYKGASVHPTGLTVNQGCSQVSTNNTWRVLKKNHKIENPAEAWIAGRNSLATTNGHTHCRKTLRRHPHCNCLSPSPLSTAKTLLPVSCSKTTTLRSCHLRPPSQRATWLCTAECRRVMCRCIGELQSVDGNWGQGWPPSLEVAAVATTVHISGLSQVA
jgi:hypothetical protein